jgi:hypothetical protein
MVETVIKEIYFIENQEGNDEVRMREVISSTVALNK